MTYFTLTTGLAIYTCLVIFFLGTTIGSFLNVCIYRIPRDESVVHPGSHCPNCNKAIAWYDNIPIVSYIALKASCRNCGVHIRPRYVLVETLVGLLFLGVWLLYGLGHDAESGFWLILDPRIPVYWLIVAALVTGTFIDFEHYILPDRITKGGMILGPLISLLVPALHHSDSMWHSFCSSCIGIVAGAGSLYLVRLLGTLAFKKEAMGLGDVKLLGAIGAFLGWQSIFFTIIISSFFGTIVGITLIVTKGKEWQSRIPYGPYLALGALCWIYNGWHLWDAYMNWVSGI